MPYTAAAAASSKLLEYPMTPCKCTGPGKCIVHNRQMTKRDWKKCKHREGAYDRFQAEKLRAYDSEIKFKPRRGLEGIELTRAAVERKVKQGVGTEIMMLLSGKWWQRLGVEILPSCKCVKHAIYLNKQGIPWCVQNVGNIVDILRHEHAQQHVKAPFLPFVARWVVRKAIRREQAHGS